MGAQQESFTKDTTIKSLDDVHGPLCEPYGETVPCMRIGDIIRYCKTKGIRANELSDDELNMFVE